MARRRAHRNPSISWPVIGAVVAGVAVVGGLVYAASKSAAAAPALPPAPAPTPTTGPQQYSFSTNNSGGSVTLHPGDSVSFAFPNAVGSDTTTGSDWFYTVAPLLVYNGRTVQATPQGVIETDTFTYGGAAVAASMPVTAQFQGAKGPATPNSGPTPPVSVPVAGSSTFNFTIITASS